MCQRAIQLFALLGILLSPFAVGQQPTTPSPADRTAEISVRGCVSGEKRYTFMQASTGAEFELLGETDRFSPVRGKLIEITGTEYAPRENTHDIPKLRVKKFQVLADKCPINPVWDLGGQQPREQVKALDQHDLLRPRLTPMPETELVLHPM